MKLRLLILGLLLTMKTGFCSVTAYQVLEWVKANQLKQSLKAVFIEQIDFNLASVYKLSDSSYIIMPLNPYGNCLLTKDFSLIETWKQQEVFPSKDTVNLFYNENKSSIESIGKNIDDLESKLITYVRGNVNNTYNKDSIIENADLIYSSLKKNRKIKEFQLAFLVVIGNYLISQNRELDCNWGILETKQLLNPYLELVLISNRNGIDKYFEIQTKVFGKWGFQGIKSLNRDIKQFWKRPDPTFNTLRRVPDNNSESKN